MATGFSSYLADNLLDAFGNATAFSVANVYVQLHVGDPGAAGTANVATETTRQSASFSAASAGVLTTDAALNWVNILGSQDATFFSVFDSATAGNFLFSGTIAGNPYTAGDTYTIEAGSLTATLSIAS
jgi:hypothetical protein